jgi:two-component system phosphate regulon sensor histidine kinase PhoR
LTLRQDARLVLVSLGLVFVAALGVYAYLDAHLARTLTATATETATARAQVAALQAGAFAADPSGSEAWEGLARDLSRQIGDRVTLLGRDGVVLGDSEQPREALPTRMNDPSRPEFQAALRGERGHRSPLASPGTTPVVFVAVPVRRGDQIIGAARVGHSLDGVRSARRHFRGASGAAGLVALMVALALAVVSARRSSHMLRTLTRTARAIAAVDPTLRATDQVGSVGPALEQVATSVSSAIHQLGQRLDRLNGILAGMEEGVLILDRDGRCELINPALREMLALAADVVGESAAETIRHAELNEVLDAARRGNSIKREIAVGGAKVRRIHVRAAPLATEPGSVYAVFVDISEMRHLETVRRDFVANVSHELRTPVTSIRSAAETLVTAATNDPAAVGTFVDIIGRNAERLHELVDDLLDLSRIESREFRLSFEDLDLAEAFAQVISLFGEQAAKRGVTLRGALPDQAPRARADRRALEHILGNLVDNAIKYSGAGSSVRLAAEKDGAMVRIEVADDGIGVDEQHLPRLFERFYRVDTGRSRHLGGTGLGLSIVKHLVESMGGQVNVTSQAGHGTAFRFTVPRAGVGAGSD